MYYEPRFWELVPEAKSQGTEIMLQRTAVFQFIFCIRIKGGAGTGKVYTKPIGGRLRRQEKAKQGNL